ncbi:hypothetical protein F4804DRAFT_232789 [Jackrogersella minutella]|nr:hypothetical protein F4804DRAFT_232789 [Jackrogersella minutella]
MERIVCSCVKCDQRLGEFINLWIKIGKNHISPIVDNQENLDVISIGTARLGEEQTLIENWYEWPLNPMQNLTNKCLLTVTYKI